MGSFTPWIFSMKKGDTDKVEVNKKKKSNPEFELEVPR